VSQLFSKVNGTSYSFYIKWDVQCFHIAVDDAFKLVTGVISETLRQFSPLSYISQGSVTTHLRCGGIFSDGIIANFLLILIMKQFRKSVDT